MPSHSERGNGTSPAMSPSAARRRAIVTFTNDADDGLGFGEYPVNDAAQPHAGDMRSGQTPPMFFPNRQRNEIQYRRIDLFGGNYSNHNRGHYPGVSPDSMPVEPMRPSAAATAFADDSESLTDVYSMLGDGDSEYPAEEAGFSATGRRQSPGLARQSSFYYYYQDAESEYAEFERQRGHAQPPRNSRSKSKRKSRGPIDRLRLGVKKRIGGRKQQQLRRSRSSSSVGSVMDDGSFTSAGSSFRGLSRQGSAAYIPGSVTNRPGAFGREMSEHGMATDGPSAMSANRPNTVAYAHDNDDLVGDMQIPGWRDQLGAAIQRDAAERFRSWCGLLVEILVPLVCVAATVVLWAAFGDTADVADSVPTNAGRNMYDARAGSFRGLMCYNDTWNGESNFIQGLSPCSIMNASGAYVVCDGSYEDPNDIPVKGLCVSNETGPTFAFMAGGGDLAMALPLDDVIAAHWLAKKQGVTQNGDAALLIAAGLASNNRYSAVGAGGKLFFAPSANVPDDMIAFFRSRSAFFPYVYNGTFDTVEAAREMIGSRDRGSTWALIEVNALSTEGMDVRIDMNQSVLPLLDRMTDPTYSGGYQTDRADMYIVSGFASLERAIFDYYMQSSYSGLSDLTKATKLNFVPFSDRMGNKPYQVGQVLTVAGTVLGFVVVLAFLYPVAQSTRRLVIEKERRIREAMLIMGMKAHWLSISWFLQCFAFNFVVSLLITILLSATFMRKSDPFSIFLVIFVFALSTIPLAGMLAAFFEKSRMAALLTPLIYFAISVPLFAMQSAPSAAIIVLCLLSPTAFAHLLTVVFSSESGDGFTIKTLRSDNFTPRGEIAMGLLAADFVIYFILMWYFGAVLPKEVGASKNPLFFILDPLNWLCKKCGWSCSCCTTCCSCCHGIRLGNQTDSDEDQGGYGYEYNHYGSYTDDDDMSTVVGGGGVGGSGAYHGGAAVAPDDGRDPDGVYEEENIPLQYRSVDVRGLRKQFTRGGKKFLAVNNLYWCMPNEGISVLLGHNGAGKSTALNMMTGMLRPDAGDCFVCGVSVRNELSAARQRIGFCPQHNILWPELTCRQHLEFFAKIKGVSGPALEDAVVKTLKEVDLLDKAEYPARGLSGGMKRKLSVAIAFVGGSPLVFLDEPTAGMDVAARRHTWELLLRMSRDRSVLLTTHFMDEADLLGDRIAIMSNGRLKCSGSSLFLKSRLGVGYNITMSVQPYASLQVLDSLVTRMIDGAESLANSGCEVSYRLPATEADSFPDLLAAVEDSGAELGIRGYSLSATTLEEVFLKVAEQDHREAEAKREAEQGHDGGGLKGKKVTADGGSESYYYVDQYGQQQLYVPPQRHSTADTLWTSEIATDNCTIVGLQFSAMIRKRFYNTRRDSRMLCFQIVCPVVCVLIAMFLNLVNISGASSQSFSYDAYLDDQIHMAVSNCSRYFNASDANLGHAASEKLTIEDPNTMDGYDLYYYTLDRWFMHGDFGRYGQIFCDSEEVLTKQEVTQGMPVVMYQNSSSYHQVAVNMVTFYNLALQGLTAMDAAAAGLPAPAKAPKITLGTTQLPSTDAENKRSDAVKTILIGLIIMIPFTFLPSNCVSWIVKERECKSRHLQDISGLRFLIYWTTNFVFDMTAYLVTLILVIIIFLIFQRDEYIGKDTAGATIVLFLVFGFCSTATAYVIHFLFSEHASAQLIVMAVGFITGFLLVIIVFILNLLPETQDASNKMRYGFRVIPTFCVGEGIINLAILEQSQLQDPSLHAFSMGVTGWPCVYMAVEIPVFIFLTLLIDHPYWKLVWQKRAYDRNGAPDPASEEDSDVEDERNQVISRLMRQNQTGTHNLNDGMVDDAVSVVLLKKCYPNGKVAVKNVTFGVVPGEVFGFLGTNGAGKTTTISILCQEFLPTSGQAIICGYDLIEDRREALKCIGYCPQFDATLDLLTVEEHLSVFAGIRAVVKDQHEKLITDLMELTGLTEYRSTLSGELSGGNRRKLSVALSLIGGPRVVFLDEPSAGMDPVARRGLWTSIQKIASKCSIVLTTHHLEEVEALADCVAIMVDGGLRCIGDKTHLKNKYGSGFEMSIRIVDVAYHDTVMAYVEENFPNATLNEYRGQRFVFALPKDVKLSEVFNTLQASKDQAGISDYSISQTSIEQVFMRISDEAEEAERIRDVLSRRKLAKENAAFVKAEKKRAKREAKQRKKQRKANRHAATRSLAAPEQALYQQQQQQIAEMQRQQLLLQQQIQQQQQQQQLRRQASSDVGSESFTSTAGSGFGYR